MSPWEGGFYERMVGVVKSCLKNCMYKKTLTHDDIATLLQEVTARVNNRPLTYIGSDPTEPEPLTPNHLLYGRTINPMPLLTTIDSDDPPYEDQLQLCEAYNTRSRLLTTFVRMWETEYLKSLRERHYNSVNHRDSPLKVGDVVLVESHASRDHWPLARVLKLLPDSQDVVRAVEVELKGHVHVKTLNKLVRLEIPDSVCVELQHVDLGSRREHSESLFGVPDEHVIDPNDDLLDN